MSLVHPQWPVAPAPPSRACAHASDMRDTNDTRPRAASRARAYKAQRRLSFGSDPMCCSSLLRFFLFFYGAFASAAGRSAGGPSLRAPHRRRRDARVAGEIRKIMAICFLGNVEDLSELVPGRASPHCPHCHMVTLGLHALLALQRRDPHATHALSHSFFRGNMDEKAWEKRHEPSSCRGQLVGHHTTRCNGSSLMYTRPVHLFTTHSSFSAAW